MLFSTVFILSICCPVLSLCCSVLSICCPVLSLWCPVSSLCWENSLFPNGQFYVGELGNLWKLKCTCVGLKVGMHTAPNCKCVTTVSTHNSCRCSTQCSIACSVHGSNYIWRGEKHSGLTQNQALEIVWIVQICNKKHTYHEHVVRNVKFLNVRQLLKCILRVFPC